VWVSAEMTRFAPETGSTTPPLPGIILPGITRLASRPCSSWTSYR
jgi:hypothetical protein